MCVIWRHQELELARERDGAQRAAATPMRSSLAIDGAITAYQKRRSDGTLMASE